MLKRLSTLVAAVTLSAGFLMTPARADDCRDNTTLKGVSLAITERDDFTAYLQQYLTGLILCGFSYNAKQGRVTT